MTKVTLRVSAETQALTTPSSQVMGTCKFHSIACALIVLTDNGRRLIHSIGRNFATPLDAWIERNIFPGACPPSLKEMMDLFESSGFSVVDFENLRLHYARTCAQWLERFERQANRVAEMFDPKCVRMWRLYVAGASAAFVSGWLQLFQIVFAPATNDQLPWTRADSKSRLPSAELP